MLARSVLPKKTSYAINFISANKSTKTSPAKMERGEMMDKQYAPAPSTARCCFPCLILSLALLSAAVLIIIFVLKPRKPSFHLHAVEMGSSDAIFSKGSNDSSTMLLLFFVAQNPNKLGIRYSSSELGLVYDSNNVGLIKVPTFFQPAHSTNVSVLVHVFFKRIDVAELVSEHTSESSSSLGDLEVRVFGGIHVRAHIFNFQLLKTQVAPQLIYIYTGEKANSMTS